MRIIVGDVYLGPVYTPDNGIGALAFTIARDHCAHWHQRQIFARQLLRAMLHVRRTGRNARFDGWREVFLRA